MDETIESVNYSNIRFVPRNCYSPNHDLVKNWVFGFDKGNESDELRAIKEANLSDAMARVAELNGLSRNDMQHLFPAVLRMLKSQSEWTK